MDLRSSLEEIRRKHGQLTPRVVLDEARSPAHPLHSRFTWDDGEAAEKWRLVEARTLIRIARVTNRDDPKLEPGRTLRAYYAVPDTKTKRYHFEPLATVVADPTVRTLVFREMERDWKALKQRYDEFDEFWQMVRADMPMRSAAD